MIPIHAALTVLLLTAANPYRQQVEEHVAGLQAAEPQVRTAAAEALGFVRAHEAESALVAALGDESAEVRRQAALALAWCGGRASAPSLLAALDDADWTVRQSAHVALTNLTGMEFPFRSLDPPERRAEQARVWRAWWAAVPSDRPPTEVLDLLTAPDNLARRRSATASTTYRGPPDVLLDGQIGPDYWQTKLVAPPQWCTIDLGRPTDVAEVVVHQYSPEFVMTEYELATSLDGQSFDVVRRERGETPVTLSLVFPVRKARYVRITSFGSRNPTYPTTFFEVEVHGPEKAVRTVGEPVEWREERGLRALGALGGQGATEAVVEVLGDSPPTAVAYRPMVRAGIRALGRLREEAGSEFLVGLLDNPFWARAAAEALGDFGDRRAVSPLLAAYARYAKRLDGTDPPDVPADDRMGFPSEDRMLETPYWIIYALARLPLDDPTDRETLRRLSPLLMANLPGDHDTFMLYEPEVGHVLTRHLIDQAGLRQEACEQAMLALGQPRRAAIPPLPLGEELIWPPFAPYRISSWLPCVCTEPEDLPRLAALLQHPNGWVRINAAKAMAWIGDRRAIEPLAKALAAAPNEAAFGSGGLFKDEEYDDPCPRWREGLVRALGLLHAHERTELLIGVMNDEGSVAEIRHAAALALADLGNPRALAALQQAAASHDFYCTRHAAADALRARNLASPARAGDLLSSGNHVLSSPLAGEGPGVRGNRADVTRGPIQPPSADLAASVSFDSLIFLQGDNDVPNTQRTVEQADRWRQTYVVTDEGPTYRPGNNLFLLRPPRPDGQVTPLTRFTDGYVAEPEVSWDGRQALFCRRGRTDPWWQVYRMNVDGSGLTQLTRGPYHHVGPAWLPDGRIVLATSRSGIRDEYHGYPCTVLAVMNADGTGLTPIATNIGRDNEPAVLYDGRIVFSRLEVFYSRNKTELTLHAAHPDGTQDVVLYGPERRAFWRNLDHGDPDPADLQEAPLTHRVLRMTQPQPMPDGRHIVVSTQGGLALIGPRRDTETLLVPDFKTRAYTTPFPLPDGRILCASTLKTPDRAKVDLGLYVFDPATGGLELIYNDPAVADYEPRPVMARRRPPIKPAAALGDGYRGRFVCGSVYNTQEPEVVRRGRLVRLIEGVPVIARHATHTGPHPVWTNHGGTLARVLGTAPLAPDGSFHAEVPADRLLHLQVLDSDRRVVGNQITWIYARPGETKSCVGCHENPHTTPRGLDPLAAHEPPLDFLPRGDEFRYRAKAWFKGSLPPSVEESTRTVRAVNLLGR